jgi:hypothetical protein
MLYFPACGGRVGSAPLGPPPPLVYGTLGVPRRPCVRGLVPPPMPAKRTEPRDGKNTVARAYQHTPTLPTTCVRLAGGRRRPPWSSWWGIWVSAGPPIERGAPTTLAGLSRMGHRSYHHPSGHTSPAYVPSCSGSMVGAGPSCQ